MKQNVNVMVKLSLGDHIYIKVAANGYYGLTDSVCKVTSKKAENGLLFDTLNTFNVEVVEHDDKKMIGTVWRIDPRGVYELVDYGKQKIAFKELQVILKGNETKVVNGHNIGIATKSKDDKHNEMFGVIVATMRSYDAKEEIIQDVIDALYKDSSKLLSKIGTADLIRELSKRIK